MEDLENSVIKLDGVFRDRSLSRAPLIEPSKFDGACIELRHGQTFSILSCSAIFHRDGGFIQPINRFDEFPMLEAREISLRRRLRWREVEIFFVRGVDTNSFGNLFSRFLKIVNWDDGFIEPINRFEFPMLEAQKKFRNISLQWRLRWREVEIFCSRCWYKFFWKSVF